MTQKAKNLLVDWGVFFTFRVTRHDDVGSLAAEELAAKSAEDQPRPDLLVVVLVDLAADVERHLARHRWHVDAVRLAEGFDVLLEVLGADVDDQAVASMVWRARRCIGVCLVARTME